MKNNDTDIITASHLIANDDLLKYEAELTKFCEGKKILQYFVTVTPIVGKKAMTYRLVTSCYIKYQCTRKQYEEQFKKKYDA